MSRTNLTSVIAWLILEFALVGVASAEYQTIQTTDPAAQAVSPTGLQRNSAAACAVQRSRYGLAMIPAAGQPPPVEGRFNELALPFGSASAPTQPQQFVNIANLIFSLRDAPPPDLCSNPPVRLPGPAPLDPAPVLAAALVANCISVANNSGRGNPAGFKTIARFNCALMLGGRSWGVTGTIAVDTQTAYSVQFNNFLIETPSGASSSQAEAYRFLSGNYANSGNANNKLSWTLQSVGLTDEARVPASPAWGGDGRVWRWNTSFTQWPATCNWPNQSKIARRADIVVNGTPSTYFNLLITTAIAADGGCRSNYQWMP